MTDRRRWSELSPRQRTAVLALGWLQLSPAAAAARDLASRPVAAVNGPKAAWAVVTAVSWVGPLTFFRWGRRSARH